MTTATAAARKPRRKSKNEHEYTLELECGSSSVEYLVLYTVDPGEPETPRSWDCGGVPGSPPSVDSFEVFYERRLVCAEHRFKPSAPRYCAACKTVLEPRPELEELVDEDALLESAGAGDDGRDWDNERKYRLENPRED